MFPNAKGSELFSVLATIDPASQAVGTAATGWISAGNHHNLLALIQSGALGTGATLDAKLQQAQDASGTGAKDLTGKAITQLTQAASGSAKQALINLRPDDLDVANGYPTLVYTPIDEERVIALDGPNPLKRSRVQVDAYARTLVACEQLQDQVLSALLADINTVADVRMGLTDFDPQAGIYRISVDFTYYR